MGRSTRAGAADEWADMDNHNSLDTDLASESLNLEESLQWCVLHHSLLPEVRKTFLFSKVGKTVTAKNFF